MPALEEVTVISKEREFDIEWKIFNYRSLLSYRSPVFSLNDESWMLEILPNESSFKVTIDYINLRLHRLSSFSPPINVEFSFAFKNVDGKKDLGKHSAGVFKGASFHSINQFLPRHEFIERKSEFISSKFLTVVCTLQKFKSSKNADDKSEQTPLYIDTNILLEGISKDFSTLLREGPHHDIEFICGDKTIKAHKNVLSCRSEVFASMLQTDMIEGNTGQVKIQDMEAATLKQFLEYLYTGVLPKLTIDIALKFYEASDKYVVEPLKKQCTSFLSENLSPDNACEVLIIADRHDDSNFKKHVMEYMIKVKVPGIEEKWTEFCKGNLLLANEVLNLLFQQFC